MFDLLCVSGPQHYYVTLSAALKEDLRFWIEAIDTWNGTCMWPHLRTFNKGVVSDACRGGFGLTVHPLPQSRVVAWADLPAPVAGVVGLFSQADLVAIQSPSIAIQWPELFSLYAGLAKAGPTWRHARILYFTDNEPNVGAVNRMATTSAVILPLLRAIALLCIMFDIQLHAVHVSGEANDTTDWTSRPDRHRFQFTASQESPGNPFVPLSPVSHPLDCHVSFPLFLWNSTDVRTRASSWPTALLPCCSFSHWLVPPVPHPVTRRTTPSSSYSAKCSVSTATPCRQTYKWHCLAGGSRYITPPTALGLSSRQSKTGSILPAVPC